MRKILLQDELASIENETEKLCYLITGVNNDFSKQNMEIAEKAWLFDTKTRMLEIIADYAFKITKQLNKLQERVQADE